VTKTKFKKGPFCVTDHGHYATVYEDREHGYHIASFIGPDECTQPIANAHLFAAAPELYEALDALEQAFMSHTHWNGDPPAEIVAARTILAKARGETP
jgi:trehalose/maltose hydrolase-like predicted phosphorylase